MVVSFLERHYGIGALRQNCASHHAHRGTGRKRRGWGVTSLYDSDDRKADRAIGRCEADIR